MIRFLLGFTDVHLSSNTTVSLFLISDEICYGTWISNSSSSVFAQPAHRHGHIKWDPCTVQVQQPALKISCTHQTWTAMASTSAYQLGPFQPTSVLYHMVSRNLLPHRSASCKPTDGLAKSAVHLHTLCYLW